MTPRSPEEVSAALREEASYLDHEKVMAAWDRWRAYIAKSGKGSLPRDDFESLFDGTQEVLTHGADALDHLTAELARERETVARLEGRLCLICGAKEPCALSKDEMSPCTFDPSPIEAAQEFQRQLHEERAAREKAERELDEAGDSLWVDHPHTKELKARVEAAEQAAESLAAQQAAEIATLRGQVEHEREARRLATIAGSVVGELERERDEARAQVETLTAALRQASAWFREYQYGHAAKGNHDKAARNAERADACDAALSATPTRTEVMPHRSEQSVHEHNATPPPGPSSGAGAMSPEVAAVIRAARRFADKSWAAKDGCDCDPCELARVVAALPPEETGR